MRPKPLSITITTLLLTLFAGLTAGYGRIEGHSAAGALADVRVSLPDLTLAQGTEITVPITVSDLTGLGVIAYDLQITFDPNVVIPASPPIDKAGTLSSQMMFSPNANYPGHLIIPAYQTAGALAGAGSLLNLKFTVVGTSEQSTQLAFENYTDPNNTFHPAFAFNEGDPGSSTTDGSVRISNTAISGTVTYGNAIGAPELRYVSNVTLTGSGSPTVTTTTRGPGTTAGRYWLSGLGNGPYVVTPSKTGDTSNAINSFDAARITRHVANFPPLLTPAQLAVADVSGNGIVSSFDAAQLSAFVVHAPIGGSTGIWKFSPVSRLYFSGNSDITGEDYTALLMGEVTGNWTNTGGSLRVSGERGVRGNGPEKNITVRAPKLVTQPNGKAILLPVYIEGVANKDIISYEFDLRYDPSVIQPQASPVDLTGTVSQALNAAVNAGEPGLLRVAVYGPMPIACNGVLLNLRFTTVGKPGSVSSVTWERIVFNEGEPRATAFNGEVDVF